MMRILAWISPGFRARSRRAHGGRASTAEWVNQELRPVDDGFEWCLIGAMGDLPEELERLKKHPTDSFGGAGPGARNAAPG
jgi:hypothetical protein